MSADAWITVGVLLVTLALLAWDRYPPAAVVLGATVSLLVLGVIEAGEAFSGFSNPAPITVAALYVLAGAVRTTGLLAPMTARLLGDGRGPGSLARLLVPAAGASAFLNNTPLVAMLIPDIVAWARRRRASASRYLLPLSYAVVLGGTITVLGTSTNLVVSGLLRESGEDPLGIFEITVIGLPTAAVGLVILILGARWLIPERRSAAEQAETEAREFVVDMEVVPGGAADGRTVAEAGLRDLAGVYLVEIDRGTETIAPVPPETTLRGDDRLVFVGRVDQIVDLQRTRGLRSAEQEHLLEVDGVGHTFHEAVIGRSSPLAGSTLKEADFRNRYQAAVVAIHRDGHRVNAKLGQVRLRPGDTLLVLGRPDFHTRWREGPDFLLVARLGGPPPSATRKAPIVAAIALAMIAVAAVGLLDILEASLLAVAALLATRVLTLRQARGSIDLDVIVLIGASFGLGAATEVTGLAQRTADGFVSAFGPMGDFGIILGLVLAAMLLTEVVTNNAAAVVLFPIAIGIAQAADLDPRSLAMAIAVAASTAFMTPIGYQTNTMVYGPGGYRFTDYVRAGAPLNVSSALVITTVTWMIA